MKYLHYEFNLSQGECVEISLDKQANVKLLDSINYQNYKRGRKYRYYGGLAKRSPITLEPPHPGHWHLVIDLGGCADSVYASVQKITF